MEDQQLQPGDLTELDDSPAPEATDTPGDGDDAATTESADGVATAAETATPGRPMRLRWAVVAVGLAAALFVGAAGFAGAMMYPYLADRALVASKLAIARAASNAITTLWTYTPEDIDTLPDRASKYLTGDFEARYRKDIDAIAGASKQQKNSVTTQVTGVAVISLNGTQASALVYTNTTLTSPQTKGIPALQYRSHQISMTRVHGHWLATELAPITKFSVTPQF